MLESTIENPSLCVDNRSKNVGNRTMPISVDVKNMDGKNIKKSSQYMVSTALLRGIGSLGTWKQWEAIADGLPCRMARTFRKER